MELEVNDSHKKIDLSYVRKPLVRFSAGILASLCIFSGMTKKNATNEIEIPPTPVEITTEIDDIEETTVNETIGIIEDQEVKIPKEYEFRILFQLEKTEEDKIYASDLEKIEYLNLTIEGNNDFSFLNYCTNLKELQITCLNNNAINFISKLPTIPSLESLSIYNIFLDLELNQNNIAFLENNPSIKYLELDGILLEPGIEEQLNKLETLRLGTNLNVDLDFSKLTNLKTLDLIETEPYTLAMHFNTEEYNTLINSGVEVILDSEYLEMFLSANQKLDEIVETLNVTKESTDREKLDAILLYTLEHLTYDPTIASISDEELENTNLASEFYKNGFLYAALEKDTAICGNYTALVEALSDRLGNPTDSFYMTSSTHAWNLMNIDGELYYVDSTWLENQIIVDKEDIGSFEHIIVKTSIDKIKEGNGEELDWYMESPDTSNIITLDSSGTHTPNIKIPNYMKQKEEFLKIDYDENSPKYYASNTKVIVKVNNEEKETSLGAIIGAMAAFGLAVSVTDKRNKKQKEDEENKKKK